MYSEAVSATAYADLFGMIGLIMALIVFLAATIWAIRLSRREVDRFARLPLTDDTVDSPAERSVS